MEALRVCDVATLPSPVEEGATTAADDDDVAVAAAPGGTQSSSSVGSSATADRTTTAANPGMLELDPLQLGDWVRSSISSGLLRGYFAAEEPSTDLIVQLSPRQAAAIESASL